MVAAGSHLVVGGELLEEIDIGQQPRAREHALEEIVAEERALRDLPLQRGLEDVDVVDALARVRAPLEEVLVDVGDRGRVGVHAAGAGDDPLVGRAAGAGRQRRRDPGLQDPVAADDASLPRLETRPVERVRDRPDQTIGGPLGKSGIGIQGDDVANPLGHRGRLSVDRHERGVRRAAQKAVQLVELTPLPLPPDPLAFTLVPQAPPMQHEEPRPPSGRALVGVVEALDPVDQGGEELVVSGPVFTACVRPVGKQGKVEVSFGVRQVVHLEPLELLFDVGPAGEKRGHDDHGSKLRRHAPGEPELGVQPGLNERSSPDDEPGRPRSPRRARDPGSPLGRRPGGRPRRPRSETGRVRAGRR